MTDTYSKSFLDAETPIEVFRSLVEENGVSSLGSHAQWEEEVRGLSLVETRESH